MMSQNNLSRLKGTVYLMILLGIVTFMSGFLKYTPFEHITLLLLFLLSVGGVKLFQGAKHTVISGYSKFFLILTGISTMVFMALIVIAIVKTFLSEVSLSDNLEFLEGLFYLSSLLFLIGIIGSIIFLNIKEGRNSKQP
ncbi:MAG: hypothetical protein GY931_16960 [Maribacter sp.]|nr:hypothetical protein [Maribacter sp.]